MTCNHDDPVNICYSCHRDFLKKQNKGALVAAQLARDAALEEAALAVLSLKDIDPAIWKKDDLLARDILLEYASAKIISLMTYP